MGRREPATGMSRSLPPLPLLPEGTTAPDEGGLMPWTTSTRRSRLPSSWPRLRLIVLARDNYACQAKDSRGIKCLLPAREVDHKVPGDNHDLSNLQALCPWHHGRKSASEGVAARPPSPTRARPSSTNPAFL